ncbi:hypothetical protein J6Q66_06710 [bacterium]|nr:hypothetical protein [bacterium]
MKKFLFLFLFLFITTSAQAKAPTSQFIPYTPYKPYNMPAIHEDKGFDYPKITQAEEQIFGKNFINEDITNRLNRLEKKLFGKNLDYLSLSERTDNISRNVGFNQYASISPNELAEMEQRIFMKIYPNDDAQMRITRLEKEVFGAMQAGDLDERYETLKSATQYYNAFPPNLANQIPYYSNPYHESFQPTKVTLPSILKTIGSFFCPPALTGYSPNIIYPNNTPYNSFDPFFNSSRGINRSFSGPGFNYDHFNNFGQGSTVNILQD